MSLHDEVKSYIKNECDKAVQESAMEIAEKLIKKRKMSLAEIAECVPTLSLDELKKMEDRIM
ncbi:hypothetical protein IMSAGC009_01366 [Lachnospiraceae bacterium]|nr:hypothetical protein IMSAGC009_01366 [Lachnospiraceae bacterium]